MQLLVMQFTITIWNTGVTWQGTDYELPVDDTIVSKHVGGVW